LLAKTRSSKRKSSRANSTIDEIRRALTQRGDPKTITTIAFADLAKRETSLAHGKPP